MKPTVGQTLPTRTIESVNAEKMKLLSALMRDPNPIHFDVASVEALGMGSRTVNQGPSNMAYVLSMLGEWAGGTDRITHYRFRFLGNVFAGERLEASGTVTSVEDVDDGLAVQCALSLTVVGGHEVLTGTGTVRLGKV
ncbi:MaoC family dehydratase [Rhodococcoides kyotonense]|uniref:Protein dehydratase n=1 Tax=Rhodococcoides kyotonense TaxID=398843 RepID=A0A177YLD4_9NOCA|nr:MaoC family dehydratase [Rhodococcus kyotonensis]OAK56374.1 protein dehydratase [Rhodococcus kyotonensis]